MPAYQFDAEVLLAAFGVYALIVVALTLWNARADRLASGGLNEAGPGGHVGHERRTQSLLDQVLGRDR